MVFYGVVVVVVVVVVVGGGGDGGGGVVVWWWWCFLNICFEHLFVFCFLDGPMAMN